MLPLDVENTGPVKLRYMDVRAAALADLPGIAAVSLANDQSDGADQQYMLELLSSGTVLVATRDGEVVGWGATRPHELGTMITDLFVDPDEHGHGIGSALLARLPTSGACFTFSSRHPAAQRAYTRIGLTAAWHLLYLAGPNGTVYLPEAHPDVLALRAAGYTEADYDVAMSRGVTLPTDRSYTPGRG